MSAFACSKYNMPNIQLKYTQNIIMNKLYLNKLLFKPHIHILVHWQTEIIIKLLI